MDIKRFVSLLLASNIAIATLTAGAFLWFSTRLSDNSAEMYRSTQTITNVHQIEAGILTHARESLLIHITRDSIHRATRVLIRDEVVRALERLKYYASTAAERKQVADLDEEVSSYFDKYRTIENNVQDFQAFAAEITADADRIKALSDQLIGNEDRDVRHSIGSLSEDHRESDWTAMLALGIIVASLGASFAAVWYFLCKPLYEIKKSIDQFRSGIVRELPDSGLTEIKILCRTVMDMMRESITNRKRLMQNIAAVAHDIRNPMAAIVTSAELALDSTPEEKDQLIEIIGRQAEHLNQMLKDLTETSQLESGNMRFSMKPCDLNEICAHIVMLFEHYSDKHKLFMVPHLTPVRCDVDSARISQVITNLISNAIKYSPDGGDVTITVTVTDRVGSIAISDNGIGIARDEIAGIFVPFQRSKRTRESIPGVGLGLATSRRIAEAHSGTLTVVSRVGKGSTFTLSLPLSEKSLQNEIIPTIAANDPQQQQASET